MTALVFNSNFSMASNLSPPPSPKLGDLSLVLSLLSTYDPLPTGSSKSWQAAERPETPKQSLFLLPSSVSANISIDSIGDATPKLGFGLTSAATSSPAYGRRFNAKDWSSASTSTVWSASTAHTEWSGWKPTSPESQASGILKLSARSVEDPDYLLNQNNIFPLYFATSQEKQARLQLKLRPIYRVELKLQAAKVVDALNQVHVFVDLSNITIGFYDTLKLQRRIPLHHRKMAAPFSFQNFMTILERGRNVTRRVLAGSTRDAGDTRPRFMQEAERLGYETNILTRVLKRSTPPHSFRQSGQKSHMRQSSPESFSEGERLGTGNFSLKHGEQGVDELLHLKIMESIVDGRAHEPGTIVLATGDAAQAEFSDGFFAYTKKALERGWRVELVAWSKAISSAWRDKKFQKTWGDRFRIIELDDYCEELLEVFAEA